MPKDSVLIIAGGLLQVPAVTSAHSLGLRAIVTDRNPDAPAMNLADEAHTVDIYDVPGHLALAERLRDRLAGVFAEGADVEVTVASVAQAIGLPGISVRAAMNCKDKTRMRATFYNDGLSPVNWTIVSSVSEFVSVPFPRVVKASDNCGSRGAHIIRDESGYAEAIADAIANGTTGTALVEEYLEGPQQSVEILFDAHGKCNWLNIVDRYFDGVMELGHVNPSRLPDERKASLFQMTEAAAGAVGVNFGAFKADTIWTEKGPRILEVTARLSGGFDCQHTTPLATGRDFIRAAMKLSVRRNDIDEDLQPTRHRWAAAWAAFPKAGKVKSIIRGGGLLSPTEQNVFLRVQEGDIIEPYEHCAQRPGFVIAVGDTYDEAMGNAQRGAAALAERIITE